MASKRLKIKKSKKGGPKMEKKAHFLLKTTYTKNKNKQANKQVRQTFFPQRLKSEMIFHPPIPKTAMMNVKYNDIHGHIY